MGLKSADRFFFVWAILGATGLIVIWFLPWRFQVNDDEIMMWLVSGAYTGKPESFAVFLHPVLSWCFAKLYTIAPEVKWYPACWFLTMFLGYLGYLRLIWSKTFGSMQAQVWSLFSLCLLLHFLFFLQFSIVSAFAISAGLASRFGGSPSEKSQVFRFYFTDLLVLIGFLIRPEILFLSLAAYLVLSLVVGSDSGAIKRLVVPALILLLGYGISEWWIEKSDLREFQRINTLRSQVFDHPMLQLYKDEFKDVDPDLYHFANGLMDFGKESDLVTKMEVWKGRLDDQRSEKFSAEFLMQAFTFFISHGRFFTLLMIAIVLFGMLTDWRKALQVLSLLLLGMLVLAPFYLLKVQIYALVFLVYFSFCLLHLDRRMKTKLALQVFFGSLFAVLLSHLYAIGTNSKSQLPHDQVRSQILDLKKQGFEEIYLIGFEDAFLGKSFNNPLHFKKMGWPTLLNRNTAHASTSSIAYLIDSVAYRDNQGYFQSGIRIHSDSDLELIVCKP